MCGDYPLLLGQPPYALGQMRKSPALPGSFASQHRVDAGAVLWWRWRESNPRPKNSIKTTLQA